MRVTQFIGAGVTLAVAVLSLPAMSTPIGFTRRDDLPEATKCNEGGESFSCSDATLACTQLEPATLSAGQRIKQIGGFGTVVTGPTADVWVTRIPSSQTVENATAFCQQIVKNCCTSTGFMSRSEIALPEGESGSIQIVRVGDKP